MPVIIIGANGNISKSLRKYLNNLPGKHENMELQETKILDNSHVKIHVQIPLNRPTTGHYDSRRLRFLEKLYMELVRVSTLGNGRLYPTVNFTGTYFCCGPDSSVGIATDYGLDDPGIASR
jgi:hypothetical protein